MEVADRGPGLGEVDGGDLRPLHRGRNVTKADVGLLTTPGGRYAVKDYRGRPRWARATIGRWSLSREERAYRALRGLNGIPPFAGRPHPHLLLTGFVEGRSLAAWERGRPLPERFFPRLKALLAAVHARGVVQGDLHHRDVLVGEDGAAWLVDFSTSLTRGSGRNPLRAAVWRLLARLDRRAVLKLQDRFEPGTLTPEERRELADRPLLHRLLRRGRS